MLKILLILQIKTEVLIHQYTLCTYDFKKLLSQSIYVQTSSALTEMLMCTSNVTEVIQKLCFLCFLKRKCVRQLRQSILIYSESDKSFQFFKNISLCPGTEKRKKG